VLFYIEADQESSSIPRIRNIFPRICTEDHLENSDEAAFLYKPGEKSTPRFPHREQIGPTPGIRPIPEAAWQAILLPAFQDSTFFSTMITCGRKDSEGTPTKIVVFPAGELDLGLNTIWS
jgi:hypothetical protein